jgi:predicted metal-dependent peptidase
MATTTAQVYDPESKAQAIALKIVPIDARQMKMWVETRTALLWNCPAFSHILYTMLNPAADGDVAHFTDEVPIAATDGLNLFLNPETFFKYTLKERVFIVAHEIMHCILDHCGMGHALSKRGKINYADGKSLPYHHETMNVAQDLVINDLLIQSNTGSFNKDWLHDPKIATQMDSAIDAYRKVFRQQEGGGGGGGGGGPGGGKRFDEHMKPGTGQGKDPNKAQSERNPTEWSNAIAAAADAAKAQGKLPAALDRFFKDLLEPQVPWGEMIRGIFARKIGSGGYDWRRPDRRLVQRDIYTPARSGFGAGTVVVAIDTSGSIGQRELDVFFAEMNGILSDVKPRRIFVIWCDAKVHKVDEVYDTADIHTLKPKGGGGTDFRPPFHWVEEQGIEPDALVYMTDLMGMFPTAAPRYPVIWAATTKGAFPWGDLVDVPIKS